MRTLAVFLYRLLGLLLVEKLRVARLLGPLPASQVRTLSGMFLLASTRSFASVNFRIIYVLPLDVRELGTLI